MEYTMTVIVFQLYLSFIQGDTPVKTNEVTSLTNEVTSLTNEVPSVTANEVPSVTANEVATISFKTNTTLNNVEPAVLRGILLAGETYNEYGVNLIVTGISDGIHKTGSLNYRGKAFDLRVWNIPPLQRAPLYLDLVKSMGDQWKVGWVDDHIHLEYAGIGAPI